MSGEFPADIVRECWSWPGDRELTDVSIQTAAQLDIARTLRRLELHLLGLGRDGPAYPHSERREAVPSPGTGAAYEREKEMSKFQDLLLWIGLSVVVVLVAGRVVYEVWRLL